MKEQLFRNSDPKWQHLIGKRAQFTSRDRLTGWNRSWVGKVEFIGINQLHSQFQVTVDRCPVWPVLENSIKEVA